MKKLPALLSTPARVVIVVGLIVLVAEFLIMVLIGVKDTYLKDSLPEVAWMLVDSIVLTAIVSTALYILFFRPMREQRADLERQLDELRRFQKLTVGRELRMKELADEIAALRNPLSAEPAGDVLVTGDSLEAPSDAAAPTTRTTEENQRSALLFMLEDLEAARRKIEQAHQEWMAALDVVDDPIFLHDKQFRILRCNNAYQQRAGIPFSEIIGQPYYEIFPKTGAPLPCCLRAMEKAEEEEEEEEEEVA
ncbi:MAG: PAS domain-containing protein, partial [Sideroxyarcus sp.]|nr:PAS domain-containing protein [Sideroxyarcus sp.]